MRNETRVLFNGYMGQQARINGVDNVTSKFNVAPSVQQKLETKIQESSDFLSRINVIGVSEMQGEKLGLGISGTIASRTDTKGEGERKTVDPTGLEKDGYECKQTNYDTHIRYATLDAWSKFKDFQARVSGQVLARGALDRITIGWHGTSAAETTDRVANPLLQDVNIGWLEKLRTRAASRVMKQGDKVAGKVMVGAGGDYAHLDAWCTTLTKHCWTLGFRKIRSWWCSWAVTSCTTSSFPWWKRTTRLPSALLLTSW